MATAGLDLMSQQAAVGLLCTTAPHTASYFYLSRGIPGIVFISDVYLLFLKFSSKKEIGGGVGWGGDHTEEEKKIIN